MWGRGADIPGFLAPSDGSPGLPDGPHSPADRRRLRGSRTRTSILEALIGLVESGTPHPSSGQIAERAGVGRRSLFHHFGDVSLVYLAALELQVARHRAVVVPIAPGGALEDRIRRTSAQRRALFEVLGPMLRAASTRVEDSRLVEARLMELRLALRGQLELAFAPELGSRPAAAGVLLDALEMASGWAHWQALRFDAHHSAATAEALVAAALTRVLG